MNNGCPDTLIKEDYVQITPPIADFRTISAAATRGFATSPMLPLFADTWNWDFGDGQTSTQQSPSHTYANPGAYTVTLVVFNNLTGCSHAEKSISFNVIDEIPDFALPRTICKRHRTLQHGRDQCGQYNQLCLDLRKQGHRYNSFCQYHL